MGWHEFAAVGQAADVGSQGGNPARAPPFHYLHTGAGGQRIEVERERLKQFRYCVGCYVCCGGCFWFFRKSCGFLVVLLCVYRCMWSGSRFGFPKPARVEETNDIDLGKVMQIEDGEGGSK
mmetsp:Transcript_4226/g.4349  ORF Transcript_4226/g.4349 Transcript_4226/m.4349 type:complete len:121 (-) Transcript_4226:342-704(-)